MGVVLAVMVVIVNSAEVLVLIVDIASIEVIILVEGYSFI